MTKMTRRNDNKFIIFWWKAWYSLLFSSRAALNLSLVVDSSRYRMSRSHDSVDDGDGNGDGGSDD